jgi:hypothetical protein
VSDGSNFCARMVSEWCWDGNRMVSEWGWDGHKMVLDLVAQRDVHGVKALSGT